MITQNICALNKINACVNALRCLHALRTYLRRLCVTQVRLINKTTKYRRLWNYANFAIQWLRVRIWGVPCPTPPTDIQKVRYFLKLLCLAPLQIYELVVCFCRSCCYSLFIKLFACASVNQQRSIKLPVLRTRNTFQNCTANHSTSDPCHRDSTTPCNSPPHHSHNGNYSVRQHSNS